MGERERDGGERQTRRVTRNISRKRRWRERGRERERQKRATQLNFVICCHDLFERLCGTTSKRHDCVLARFLCSCTSTQSVLVCFSSSSSSKMHVVERRVCAPSIFQVPGKKTLPDSDRERLPRRPINLFNSPRRERERGRCFEAGERRHDRA